MTSIQKKLAELREKSKDTTDKPWIFIDREGDYPSSWISAPRTTGYDEEDYPHTEVCHMPSTAYGYESQMDNNGPFIVTAANSYDTLLEVIGELSEGLLSISSPLGDLRDVSDAHHNDMQRAEQALTKAQEMLEKIEK